MPVTTLLLPRVLFALLLGSCLVACARGPSEPHTAFDAHSTSGRILPLKSIRLYETGLGYFERTGTLDAGQGGTLPVPAAHVDDALKTLVVLGNGGKAQVSSIEFSSVLSSGLARVIAGISTGNGKPIRYLDVLESLRGLTVQVELRSDSSEGTLEGTLLEVAELPVLAPAASEEDEEPPRAEASPEQYQLTLLSVDGAIHRLTTEEVRAIRPIDPAIAERLNAAALTLSKRAAQLQRGLHVVAQAGAPVRLGYIAETPVWRTTYRLLTSSSDRLTLQGWALLHNDTDEAWQDVTVELVNGQPDSFLFPLAAPRYLRRELAEPSQVMSTAPQLSRQTADQIWGEHVEPDPDEEEMISLSGVGRGGGGQGSGIGIGTVGTLGHGSGYGRAGRFITTTSDLSIGNLAEIAPAVGEEGLALFSYRLSAPIHVRAHGSALVPFLSESLEGERITWFDGPAEQGRSAALLLNSTNKTLPPGVVAVYEPAGFVGETGIERLKPNERQLLRFGIDLDVALDTEELTSSEETKKIEFEDDHLHHHYLRHASVRYSVTNRSGLPRTVHALLHVRDNSRVKGAKLDYHTKDGGAAAVFEAPPGRKSEWTLEITQALRRVHAISSLDQQTVQAYQSASELSGEQRIALQRAHRELGSVEQTRKQLDRIETRKRELTAQQERLHDHERRLRSKEETPAGIVTRLLALEDDMTRLGEQEKALREQLASQEQLVREALEALAPAAAKQ